MPNWCQNSIKIEGPADKIKALWEKAENADFSKDADGNVKTVFGLLQAMRPMPEELRGTTKGSGEELQTTFIDGCNNWYDWRVKHWGTKWDIDSEGLDLIENSDGTAEITGWFDSAWSPPVSAYEHFVSENPELKLYADYYESGDDFTGVWEYDGEDIRDQYFDSISDELEKFEDKWDPAFRELNDNYGFTDEEWRFEDEDNEDEGVPIP